METKLVEIRKACITYLNTKVTMSISPIESTSGGTINPGENFTFSVTAHNEGEIALMNVRYLIKVGDPAVAKLIVPSAPMIARKGANSSSMKLRAGAQVSEMYLFPPAMLHQPFDSSNYLNPGDSDTITGLRGQASSALNGGETRICVKILADIDLNYLFPKNEDSAQSCSIIRVIG